jgi:heme exporter protein CcmB
VTGLPLAVLALCWAWPSASTGEPRWRSPPPFWSARHLSLIERLAAALALGARRGGALLALLALPLCVPTLIFGAAAIESLMTGEDLLAPLGILAALALVALATTPWAMAAALRQAGE